MGTAYGTYRGKERCIQGFGRDTSRKDDLEDLVVDGRIMLK
jgi:hypothetical protein